MPEHARVRDHCGTAVARDSGARLDAVIALQAPAQAPPLEPALSPGLRQPHDARHRRDPLESDARRDTALRVGNVQVEVSSPADALPLAKLDDPAPAALVTSHRGAAIEETVTAEERVPDRVGLQAGVYDHCAARSKVEDPAGMPSNYARHRSASRAPTAVRELARPRRDQGSVALRIPSDQVEAAHLEQKSLPAPLLRPGGPAGFTARAHRSS